MLLTPGPLPEGDDWIFEPKFDGYRVIFSVRKRVQIWTRKGNDITDQFPSLQSVRKLFDAPIVADAELVALDDAGMPQFERIRQLPPTLYTFDILAVGDERVTALPLIERRALLERYAPPIDDGFMLSRWFTDGTGLHEELESRRMEGTVGKRLSSPYEEGKRSKHWVKKHTKHGAETIRRRFGRFA